MKKFWVLVTLLSLLFNSIQLLATPLCPEETSHKQMSHVQMDHMQAKDMKTKDVKSGLDQIHDCCFDLSECESSNCSLVSPAALNVFDQDQTLLVSYQYLPYLLSYVPAILSIDNPPPIIS